MRLKVVVPVNRSVQNYKVLEHMYDVIKEPNTQIEVASLKKGPETIEQYYDRDQATPYILQETRKAQSEGVDGVVIFCFADPAVQGSREALRIPVLGLCEPSVHFASILGNKFSILTPLVNSIPMMEELVVRYGLGSKLASIRPFHLPVSEIGKDAEKTRDALLSASKKAVEEDGADLIIFGCGGIELRAPKVVDSISSTLSIPVLEPGKIAIKMMESLVRTCLVQSKRSYLEPRPKKRTIE